jgi:mono/diheme cytochrome c family protein
MRLRAVLPRTLGQASPPCPRSRASLVVAATAFIVASSAGGAGAQVAGRPSVGPPVLATSRFSERGGEALYANVCQACHMERGEGAVGAGRYPALANNPKLEVAGYPLSVVLHGLNGMPPVARMMSDEQVAEVINYVRTHFGNAYTDPVTPQDVTDNR